MNIGMVPQSHSTFPSDPTRGDDYRGLLFDWGFAAVDPLLDNSEVDMPVIKATNDVIEVVWLLLSHSSIQHQQINRHPCSRYV